MDCINSVIDVIIATGKSIDSVMFLIEQLGLKLPLITLNGSVVVSPERKIISSVKIPVKLYLNIVQRVRERGYKPMVATVDGKIYCQEYSEPMDYLAAVGEKIIRVDDITSDYFKYNAANISIPINESDPLDQFIRKTYEKRLQVVRSGEYFFDILSLEASKGRALTSLIAKLGIKKEEVVSFGDSHNDISLLKASGLKIAVKNSYPELLEIADIVTDENYMSGLGKAIYKYVLKK